MDPHTWSTLLVSAFVGLIVSLPTGPTGAYVVSRRMSEGSTSMIAAIAAIVMVDHFYIVSILEGKAFIQHLTQNAWISIGFCIAILTLGLHKITHPLIAKSPTNKNSHINRTSSSAIGSAITAGGINALNPLLVLSLISLLTTFGLNDGSHEILPIIIGFSVGCIGLWVLIGFFLQHSFKYAQEHLRIIIQSCGVLMVISALITLGTTIVKVT